MNETNQAPRRHITRLENALRQVEQWSFDNAIDLTDAGYSQWSALINGPRTPLTIGEARAVLDEIEEARR